MTENKEFAHFCSQLYMEYLQEQHDLGNYNDVMSSEEYRTKYTDYLQKRYNDERNTNWYFKTTWDHRLFRGARLHDV